MYPFPVIMFDSIFHGVRTPYAGAHGVHSFAYILDVADTRANGISAWRVSQQELWVYYFTLYTLHFILYTLV